MVTGGTVMVAGTIGGRAVQTEPVDGVTIEVTDRDWSSRQVTLVRKRVRNGEDSRLGTLPNPPRVAQDLGRSDFYETVHPRAAGEELPSFQKRVGTGPNTGWYYLSNDAQFTVYGLYQINDEALSPRSDFWQAQEVVRPGGGFNGFCTQISLNSVRGEIEAHELRHLDYFEEGFNKKLVDLIADVERAVDDAGLEPDNTYWDAWNTATDAGSADSGVIDEDGHPGLAHLSDRGRPCNLQAIDGGLLPNRAR